MALKLKYNFADNQKQRLRLSVGTAFYSSYDD